MAMDFTANVSTSVHAASSKLCTDMLTFADKCIFVECIELQFHGRKIWVERGLEQVIQTYGNEGERWGMRVN